MNTYIKNASNEFFAVRASRAEVSKLPRVVSGELQIVPTTKQLRESAKLNIDVKTLRIMDGGKLGYL